MLQTPNRFFLAALLCLAASGTASAGDMAITEQGGIVFLRESGAWTIVAPCRTLIDIALEDRNHRLWSHPVVVKKLQGRQPEEPGRDEALDVLRSAGETALAMCRPFLHDFRKKIEDILTDAGGDAAQSPSERTGPPPLSPGKWTRTGPGIAGHLFDIAHGNDRFVAVGSRGTILVSPDGRNWWRQHAGISISLNGIAYGSDRFVAVGDYGVILVSEDGVKWNIQDTKQDRHIRGVTYGGDRFVAVGDDGIKLASNDGESWTMQFSVVKRDFEGVAFGKGRFVAVGKSGTLRNSVDGLNWSGRIPWDFDLTAVAFGPGKFIAAAAGGRILLSPDGLNWEEKEPACGNCRLNGIAPGKEGFAAVGGSGKILISMDGEKWEKPDSGTNSHLTGILYAENKYVVVGHNSEILVKLVANSFLPDQIAMQDNGNIVLLKDTGGGIWETTDVFCDVQINRALGDRGHWIWSLPAVAERMKGTPARELDFSSARFILRAVRSRSLRRHGQTFENISRAIDDLLR